MRHRPVSNRHLQHAAVRTLAPAILILAATLLAFHPVLSNTLTDWDDTLNITLNPFLNPPSISGLHHLWTQPYQQLYIPLTYTSWALDLLLGSGHVRTIFITNLLLHAASAWIVYQLLRHLLPPLASQPPANPQFTGAALAGALLFTLHPVQVEPVAWATGRKDLLSGFLALLAFLLYLQSNDPARTALRNRVAYAIAFLCFLAALLAKPAAVALPVALLVTDTLLFNRPIKGIALRLAPFFLLALAFVRITSQAQPTTPDPALSVPFWTRPFIAADALTFYLRLLTLPFDLSATYNRTPLIATTHWWGYISLPIVIAALAFAWKRSRLALITALLFIALLLPILGLIPFQFQTVSTVADRYLYLPLLAVSLLLGAILLSVPSRRGTESTWALVALLLLGLAFLSWKRTDVWADGGARLWEDALAKSPHSPLALVNQASKLNTAHRPAEALKLLDRALAIQPDNFAALGNRGLALRGLGRNDEALADYNRALTINPDSPDILYNRALILISTQRGASPDILADLQKAAAANPRIPGLMFHLGLVESLHGDTQRAIDALTAALQQEPDRAEIYQIRSLAYEKLGLTAQAQADRARALTPAP